MMISNVKGQFTGLSGELTHDENDPANSSVEANIDATTINTREPQRDAHLKSADFFDVEKFPAITFNRPPSNARATMNWRSRAISPFTA